jgi:hypothetical protein
MVKRITISLNPEISADKAIMDFLSALPRRSRSDTIKEVLYDALKKDKPAGESLALSVENPRAHETDAETVLDNLFL